MGAPLPTPDSTEPANQLLLMAIRHIYTTTVATTNDTAHIDVLSVNRLLLIEWSLSVSAITSGDRIEYELSLASASQYTNNDANGIISILAVSAQTSLVAAPQNKVVPCNLALPALARIYLHVIATATATARCNVQLHFAR